MTYKLDGWPRKKNRAPLLDYIKLCASFQSHRWIQTCVMYSLEMPNSGQNRLFFVQYNLEIWWMTLKYNKAPLLCYFKLCASFRSHWSVSLETPSRVKISDFFLSCLTLQFDRCPWKTIGYILYGISIFVHHFIAIGQFKLELQPGNAKFGSKSFIFCPVWPWNLMDDLEKQ